MKFSEVAASVLDTPDDVEVCLITGDPLTTPHVTLECGHEFNYYPLMHSLFLSRFVTPRDGQPELELIQFIKLQKQFGTFGEHHIFWCPYCRQPQTTVVSLPENADKMYGINTEEHVNELRIRGCKWIFTPTHSCSHIECMRMSFTDVQTIYAWTTCEPCTNKHYCWAHLNVIEHIKRQIKHQNKERLKRGLEPLALNPLLYLYNTDQLTTTYCNHTLIRGIRKGLLCKRITKNGAHMCKQHSSIYINI